MLRHLSSKVQPFRGEPSTVGKLGAYWPAGTAAFHVKADIASTFEDYSLVIGVEQLACAFGLEVLIETARLWRFFGRHDWHGIWHIDGVTLPDEYMAVVNDNVFTNVMAARNLGLAAAACSRLSPQAQDLGVHPRCEEFTRLGE